MTIKIMTNSNDNTSFITSAQINEKDLHVVYLMTDGYHMPIATGSSLYLLDIFANSVENHTTKTGLCKLNTTARNFVLEYIDDYDNMDNYKPTAMVRYSVTGTYSEDDDAIEFTIKLYYVLWVSDDDELTTTEIKTDTYTCTFYATPSDYANGLALLAVKDKRALSTIGLI